MKKFHVVFTKTLNAFSIRRRPLSYIRFEFSNNVGLSLVFGVVLTFSCFSFAGNGRTSRLCSLKARP